MGNNCNICSFKCFGVDNYHGSCCSVEDRDFIIGPHLDSDEFLEKLSNKFGRQVNFEEVFFSFEEGKELFKEKSSWQNPNSYPAMKIDINNTKKPCIFYNMQLRACNIYDIRPETCRTFECDYLKSNS